MQIPTNPRIASSLALGTSKADKESSTANAAVKPAYISVQPSNKLSSHDDADVIMKVIFFFEFYSFLVSPTLLRISLYISQNVMISMNLWCGKYGVCVIGFCAGCSH